MLKKGALLLLVLLLTQSIFGQRRTQVIGYIDMNYILENYPNYIEAQQNLEKKTKQWKSNLTKLARKIEVLKTDLASEKVLLTRDLIQAKEEEISFKQEEYNRLEFLYFGPNGDLYQYRKRLVAPVQERVYNIVQEIGKAKKYDIIFNKSSDLILLYSNKKYDISELVLAKLKKKLKKEAAKALRKKKNN